MTNPFSRIVTTLGCLVMLGNGISLARDLTLEDRIEAQEAIERVYWEHRIWPSENAAPKPALGDVLTRSEIRARVIDYIRKSNALAALWNRPITAKQLQAEMQRMAAESQAPDVLRELFAALGGDPFTIAETLARQTLADRLIREAYAGDDRSGVGIGRLTPAPLVGGLGQAADSGSRRRSFDAWWADAGASAGEDLAPVSESIQAVEIPSAPACVADSWRSIPPGPAPFIGHAAVWTGTEMIIWGQYSTGYPASGGRFNPATNSWSVTSNFHAPVTRYAHSAVWTGTEMIVWGGHLNGVAYPAGYLNDGGRYNPTTNSWRPTSAGAAPQSRESHSAVWTGSEMIIWGGDTPQGTTNTGRRYDPVNDRWGTMSGVDAPETRSLHSAVWTGTEMIVWGGDSTSDGYGYVAINTGGLYNPSTDTWTATSLANAPSRRSRHTAVWTGSRMIVWGGGSFYYWNSGGVYDPSRNTWTPTSMSGALPDGRESHSAVWTGREMIISGGHQGGQPFNGHGGRYDPALDVWVPISSLGEPIARPTATAVWTGNEMLVWGGYAGTSDGYSGRYCASACGVEKTLYKDLDGDGYGNPAESIASCDQLQGFVDNAGDCNDQDARIHPGATETCNGLDDNCDGRADEEFDVGSACSVVLDECHELTGTEACLPDGSGTTCQGAGVMHDVTPPVLTCPPDTTLECPATAGGAGLAVATDACDPSPAIAMEAPGSLALGTNRILWTATDASGNSASCVQSVSVVDTRPPQLSVAVSPGILWPPNHQMVDVRASVGAIDACGSSAVTLTSVTGSEQDNAPGGRNGSTTGDIQGAQIGAADFGFQLQAERSPRGGGRIYTVTYRAVDASGNASTAMAIVIVPHDLSGMPLDLRRTLRQKGGAKAADPSP